MKKVVYIHGAFSSGVSFQRIMEALPKHEMITPQYDVKQSLGDIIDAVNDLIIELDSDVHIVSHSLGGIVGVGVAHINDRVKSVLTMSTPFGGSRLANTLRWFNTHELYRSLASNNPILTAISRKPLECDLKSIITTVGNNPMMFEKNDGVVSLKSQTALQYGEKVAIPLNHFEVLLSNETVNLVKNFTFKK
jgi:pimeloyl-ACP methyl ester carboxylesterase